MYVQTQAVHDTHASDLIKSVSTLEEAAVLSPYDADIPTAEASSGQSASSAQASSIGEDPSPQVAPLMSTLASSISSQDHWEESPQHPEKAADDLSQVGLEFCGLL